MMISLLDMKRITLVQNTREMPSIRRNLEGTFRVPAQHRQDREGKIQGQSWRGGEKGNDDDDDV
jgi:hypothetical protein